MVKNLEFASVGGFELCALGNLRSTMEESSTKAGIGTMILSNPGWVGEEDRCIRGHLWLALQILLAKMEGKFLLSS